MTPDLQKHEEIKMRLRLAGSSLANIAQGLNVSATTVTQVSQGRHRSKRIEGAIAGKLGTTPEALWPDRGNCGAEPEKNGTGGKAQAPICI